MDSDFAYSLISTGIAILYLLAYPLLYYIARILPQQYAAISPCPRLEVKFALFTLIITWFWTDYDCGTGLVDLLAESDTMKVLWIGLAIRLVLLLPACFVGRAWVRWELNNVWAVKSDPTVIEKQNDAIEKQDHAGEKQEETTEKRENVIDAEKGTTRAPLSPAGLITDDRRLWNRFSIAWGALLMAWLSERVLLHLFSGSTPLAPWIAVLIDVPSAMAFFITESVGFEVLYELTTPWKKLLNGRNSDDSGTEEREEQAIQEGGGETKDSRFFALDDMQIEEADSLKKLSAACEARRQSCLLWPRLYDAFK